MIDVAWIIIFFIVGLWEIYHAARAVGKGVFHGWYKGTGKDYYTCREKNPVSYWLDVLTMSFVGALTLGLAIILADQRYAVFDKIFS
ncbi:hypothetical protein ABN154_08855 [Klebsiella michiganensis]|uniref:hypothetical protein n=1 Tax=Klebsiella michiganensis TaxID=1134687 RepID=UPI0032DB2068